MSESGAIALEALLAGYPTADSRFDEATAAGAPRPHWRHFLSELSTIDVGEFARRQATARRMIRDNGVTYNVYDEAGGTARPWELDILPLLTSAEDWAILEAGVIQRARLADAILSDVYGPQRLILQGELPPHLVHGHPQFLRPLSGIAPAGGVRVHLYSADVGRAPDGSWIVLSDRVDAPSGVGYALENRIVVSQTFPELFRDCRVRRLAGFFQAFREGVIGLAPAGLRRGVLLTPGPYNEAYFEHAFLAHYLGIALVEGEDLSVRDGRVYLKTVGGLERIDVIFRRIDSDYCDPLELRADSALGVPGLVEAVRAGTVVMANALGSAVAESPALAAFLPRLCRALFGAELLLPGVRTIWCGTSQGRTRTLEALDHLVVRDAFDDRPLFSRGSTARIGAELSGEERKRLAERLSRRGAGVIAQELTPLGVAPTREGGQLTPRPVALRVFAAWTPNGYVVMPGGLARVARDDGRQALSMQSGAASKDIWVLAEALDRHVQPQTVGEPMPIRRVGDEAPSRAMDNLLWLGRYAERAEYLVRAVRAIVVRLGDDVGLETGATAADLARRLLVPHAQLTEAAALAADRGNVVALATELRALVIDRKHPRGLRRMLDSVERTAWTVRDRLSVDTWRAIIAFAGAEPIFDARSGGDPAGLRDHLDTLVRRSAALSGLSAENMTRSRNWLFLDLGRRIERAIALTWLARQMLTAADRDGSQSLQLALEIADSTMTYRYRYRGSLQVAPVLDLLLFDATNPRAVAFQVATIAGHVNALPRAMVARRQDAADVVDAMQEVLGTANPEAIARIGEDGRRFGLTALLDFLADAIPRVSDAVEDAFFRHSTAHRTGSAPRHGN